MALNCWNVIFSPHFPRGTMPISLILFRIHGYPCADLMVLPKPSHVGKHHMDWLNENVLGDGSSMGYSMIQFIRFWENDLLCHLYLRPWSFHYPFSLPIARKRQYGLFDWQWSECGQWPLRISCTLYRSTCAGSDIRHAITLTLEYPCLRACSKFHRDNDLFSRERWVLGSLPSDRCIMKEYDQWLVSL